MPGQDTSYIEAGADTAPAAQTSYAAILAAQPAPASSEVPAPWWRSWWLVALTLAAGAVVLVTLVWPG